MLKGVNKTVQILILFSDSVSGSHENNNLDGVEGKT